MEKTSFSFFVRIEFNEDSLVHALATLIERGEEIAHPVMLPDEFAEQINQAVFERVIENGQSGITHWVDDLRTVDLLKAEWFLKGACIEGSDVTDFLS